MSRVEPKDQPAAPREAEHGRTSDARRIDHTPGKAEGDERTIDEALRNQEESRQQ